MFDSKHIPRQWCQCTKYGTSLLVWTYNIETPPVVYAYDGANTFICKNIQDSKLIQ